MLNFSLPGPSSSGPARAAHPTLRPHPPLSLCPLSPPQLFTYVGRWQLSVDFPACLCGGHPTQSRLDEQGRPTPFVGSVAYVAYVASAASVPSDSISLIDGLLSSSSLVLRVRVRLAAPITRSLALLSVHVYLVERQFGRMLRKSPGDNAKVAVLLTDYEDVDRVLAKIIDAAKSWRDSWVNISSTQLGVVTEYDGLWDPIVGASEGLGKQAVPTPELQLEQTLRLKEVYTELNADLLEELQLIEARVVKPASCAREYIDPMRKTIKKRENKRLDFEKIQEKTTKLQRKPGRTSKEDASLAKLEAELARVSEDFHAADAHLRETLPPIVTTTFSIIPLLIDSVVALQNRFLGLYYTTLHTYCEEHGFPSPPPPMDEVIAAWSASYEPAKRDFESLACIATGKAVRQPMRLPDDLSVQDRGQSVSPSASTLTVNGPRRSSSGLISSNGNMQPARPNRIPSTTMSSPQPSPVLSPRPFIGANLTPTDFTTASRLGEQLTPAVSSNSPRPRSDYFYNRPPSTASTAVSTVSINSSASGASFVAAKKKPPPPPPPKKIISRQPEEFVVALYTYTGQGTGDLSFREGDRIKIVKKTDTLDDWWEGELGGVKGSFPANYCKAC
ncbi:hypothetical protein NUW58_g1573 [Xylaria curta]|uniref:Uncharacterized protein n=1 Tax=Xylaria curta TaxID=42375 RepID=A0ACC1PJL7_9PEZI|nr:hypothetical protein NUW58_g1573 [Xylaria curta]